MSDELLTPAQAAKLKGVSRSAIYKAIGEGRIPHAIVLGRLALKKDDVLNWVPQGIGVPRKSHPMSDEAKLKLSKSQTLRWKLRKVQGKRTDLDM